MSHTPKRSHMAKHGTWEKMRRKTRRRPEKKRKRNGERKTTKLGSSGPRPSKDLKEAAKEPTEATDLSHRATQSRRNRAEQGSKGGRRKTAKTLTKKNQRPEVEENTEVRKRRIADKHSRRRAGIETMTREYRTETKATN